MEEQNKTKQEQIPEENKSTEQLQEEDKNWLEGEAAQLKDNKFDDSVPNLTLEEGKVTELEIDFSKPFDKWVSPDGVVKKIVPVKHAGVDKKFWLNVKNPVYSELVGAGLRGQTKFKILRTGQKQQTRYTLVKD